MASRSKDGSGSSRARKDGSSRDNGGGGGRQASSRSGRFDLKIGTNSDGSSSRSAGDVGRPLPRGPASEAKSKMPVSEVYGMISAIKQGFGFLQPIIEEEQIYFGGRELTPDMKMGDRVGFITRESARGLAAENVRLLTSQVDKVVASAKGTVSRSPDRHRSNCGMLTIDVTSLDARSASLLDSLRVKEVPFLPVDVIASSVPRSHRLDRGDFVEFSLHRVVGSNLFVARTVSMLQLKRDRAVAVQIQRMLDAGVAREQGVVSALKKGEYGFIKPLDRKEEIYFRLEDGKGKGGEEQEADDSGKLAEGDEVEFFVITECVKGKMSDRAIHVRGIPKGSVKFEVVLASAVAAVVIAESGSRPDECPGIARLDSPVSVTSVDGADPILAAAAAAASAKKGGKTSALATTPSINTIELWQRCLPDELSCRVGDVLRIDVHYYRPEKLFFARGVKVVRFRALGREKGTICALKENGFGFIHSVLRNMDIYFKSSQVLGWDSLPISDSALRLGAVVSFDVVSDEGGGAGKLRAKRVMLEDPVVVAEQIKDDIERYTLLQDVTGVVIRTSTKRDSPGMIKVQAGLLDELDNVSFCDPDIVRALEEFKSCAELQHVTLPGLPLSVVRSYSQVIKAKFEGVAFESTQASTHDPAQGFNLKIFKLTGEKYDEWKAAHPVTAKSVGKAGNNAVAFFKEEYVSPEYGPLANDLKVTFQLCWDPARGKRLARNIRLTDEPVLDSTGAELGPQLGVVDVLVDKGEKYGFIRCIPSDEKLFWHMSSSNPTAAADAAPLMLGSEVSFQLRRRGGLRCAANITVLHPGSLATEERLPETCLALIVSVSPPRALLVDTSAAPALRRKYVDVRTLSEATSSRAAGSDGALASTWNKLSLDDSSPASAEENGFQEAENKKMQANDTMPVAEDVVVASVTEAAGDSLDYKAKFFSVLPRSTLPFQNPAGLTVLVGDVMQCQVTVKWAIQRSPEFVTITAKSADPTLCGLQKKARINKLRFRAKALPTSAPVDADTLSSYNLGNLDMVELLDPSTEGELYYCPMQELLAADENSRDVPQQGDEVHFWVIPALGAPGSNIALHAKLLPKPKDFGGIQFSKRPIAPTSAADNKAKASPLTLITMAEGPPSDSARGFPVGWRSSLGVPHIINSASPAPEDGEPVTGAAPEVGATLTPAVVSELPWANLLQHLLN